MANPNGDNQTGSEPIYNIGAVSRMTGIPTSTLRVWERRYGFPAPFRTDGGHRLYTEQDIVRLNWIKQQIDAGMQVGQAVEALRQAEESNRFPGGLLREAKPEVVSYSGGEVQEASLEVFRRRLTDALLAYDTTEADRVLAEILSLYSIESVIYKALVLLLAEMGDEWAQGNVSVTTEHFITHYLRQYLLMWMQTAPPNLPVKPVVLACAPGEWHEISLVMFGLLLRRLRWPVVNLGQSVPLDDLARFVQEIQPPAVVLVAMTENPAHELAKWPRALPEAFETKHPIIAYGGRVFTEHPQWTNRVPGLFLGTTLEEGVETLDQLLLQINTSDDLTFNKEVK